MEQDARLAEQDKGLVEQDARYYYCYCDMFCYCYQCYDYGCCYYCCSGPSQEMLPPGASLEVMSACFLTEPFAQVARDAPRRPF